MQIRFFSFIFLLPTLQKRKKQEKTRKQTLEDMGLIDSAYAKEMLKKMAPSAVMTAEEREEALKITKIAGLDATLEFYTAITGCSDITALWTAPREYFRRLALTMPLMHHFVLVFDTVGKPVVKSVMREKRSAKKFTPEEAENYCFAFRYGPNAPSEASVAKVVAKVHAEGVASGAIKQTDSPFGFFAARSLRTPRLRQMLFNLFADSLDRLMKSSHAPFYKITFDGIVLGDDYSETDYGKRITWSLTSGKLEKTETPVVFRGSAEADLRIIEFIEHMAAEESHNLVLMSRDTDVIFTVLMSMDTWNENTHVALNLGIAKVGQDDEFYNMRVLRTQMREWALTKVPVPIFAQESNEKFERIATLAFLLGGSDYVERPKSFSLKSIWDFFETVGFAFFYNVDLRPRDDYEWRCDTMKILTAFVCLLMASDHKTDKKIPARYERLVSARTTALEILGPEKLIQKPDAKKVCRQMLKSIPPPSALIKECESRTKAVQGVLPTTAEDVLVYVAKVVWNYLYWNRVFVDPLGMRDGASLWGWEMVDGVVRSASKIH